MGRFDKWSYKVSNPNYFKSHYVKKKKKIIFWNVVKIDSIIIIQLLNNIMYKAHGWYEKTLFLNFLKKWKAYVFKTFKENILKKA